MKPLLVDTNVVSILFRESHPLTDVCEQEVVGEQLLISFMTRAEVLLWADANQWGDRRRRRLESHLSHDFTTLFADTRTCEIWSLVTAHGRRSGRSIAVGDAWIAAAALRWESPAGDDRLQGLRVRSRFDSNSRGVEPSQSTMSARCRRAFSCSAFSLRL